MTTLAYLWQTRAWVLHASGGFAIGRVILVALLIAGMLIAFHSVVRGALHTGELRRQAFAAQAIAMRDCKVMPGPASARCLKELIAHGFAADDSQLAQTVQSGSVQAD